MSKMERARAQVSILGVISLLVISALMVWKPTEEASGKAAMLAPDPPGIDVTQISILPPETGSRVIVETTVNAFSNATAGTTEVMTRDLTTGAESTWTDWANKPLSIKFSGGGYGDLIEVVARNGAAVSSAVVGTVPAPADVAPPDLTESAFNGSGTSTFSVSWPAGSIFDGSFPGTASLSIVGETNIDTTTIYGNSSGSNSGPGSLSVSVTSPAAGKRAELTVEDNYGNRTTLEFIVGQNSILDAGSAIFHGASPNQAKAERAGTAGMVSAGDSGASITVYGQDLLYSVSPYSANAPILDLLVQLNYRSGIAHGATLYDGPVGKGFDWTLDSRVERVSGGLECYWYPGDGRRIGPFDFDRSAGGVNYYDSPTGIFLQLTYVKATGEAHLTHGDGSRMTYDSKTGMLIRLEDFYGYESSPPTDSALNQIRLIRDDDEKVVQAILGNGQVVRFGWFHHNRLASIRHHDRTAYLTYNDDGELSQVTFANGSSYSYGYTANESLLSDIVLDPVAAKIGLLTVVYGSAGTRPVTCFETRDTLLDNVQGNAGVLYALAVSGNELTVTDPEGDVMVYAHSGAEPHFLDYIETRTDPTERSTSNGYPSTEGDPYAWREVFTVDTDNYLVDSRRLLKAQSGANDWASPDVSDWHQWSYVATGSAADDDPRLRSRVHIHSIHDPSTGVATFTEEWVYGERLGSTDPGDDQFPSEHESLDGVITKTIWNDAGQLTESRIEGVTTASSSPTSAYDIVSQWRYDLNGRLKETVSPDRYDPALSTVHGNTVNTYSTTSGSLDYGYLSRTDRRDENGGDTGPWREFERDAYGNVSLERSPNRMAGSDNETEYTYDDLNRVVAVLQPAVTLERYSSSQTIRHETETDYGALGGFAVSQSRQSYFNEFGVRGTGQGNANPEWLLTDYTYNAGHGRLEVVESDFEYDGGLERTKQETFYDDEGRVRETLRYHASGTSNQDDKHVREERHYDAAGRLLLRETDPDDNATGGEDAYEWWYRYDGLGRVVVSFTPENSKSLEDSTRTGAVTEYDVYGRVTKQSSGKVRLDPTETSPTNQSNVEEYWTKPFYVANKFRAEGSGKMFGATQQLSEVRYEFDEAGRVNATRTWYAGEVSNRKISYAPVDLFPSGGEQRRYVPWEQGSAASWELYVESLQDDHNRVAIQQSVDDSGTGINVWWKTESVYDNASGGDRTGWMLQSKRTDYDEVTSMNVVFATDYTHDELGRVVDRAEHGTATTAQRHYLTRFNGMGQVFESFYADDVEGDFTENGVIQKTLYNFAGRPVDLQRGFNLSGDRSWRQTDYDLLGRVVTQTMKDYQTSGGLPDRVYSTSYDDLGRTTTQSNPQITGTASNIAYSYSHTAEGYPYVDRTDPLGRKARTLRNESGQVLSQTLEEPSASLGGATAIYFSYGDGCGCSGAGKPVKAQTYSGTTTLTELTRVDRVYSPLGQVLEETITVDPGSTQAGSLEIEMVSSFQFDAAGRRVNLTYPKVPIGDNTRSELDFLHRSDGRVTEMTLSPAEGDLVDELDLPFAEFKYVGNRPSEILIRELEAGGTGSPYVTIGHDYDPLGRLVVKDFVFEPFAGQFPDFTDEVDSNGGAYEFDLDGRILARKEPPRTASQTTSTYSVFTYSGAGWLDSQGWGLTKSGVTYNGGTQQDFVLNHFGETIELGEEVVGGAIFGTGNFYEATIPYERDSANGRIEKIPASSATDDHYQAITFDACASPEPGSQYADLHWYVRDPVYNDMGQMTSLTEIIRQYVSCDQELCDTGDQTEETELRYINNWVYTYDVWGRIVAAYQKRERMIGSEEGCVTQVSTLALAAEDERTDEWVYDAYGRVVKSSQPVQRSSRLESTEYTASIRLYHAYDGGLRIFSTDDDSYVPTSTMVTNHLDTFREVFRDPNSGQTLKFRNYRSDMGHSGASEWPGNTKVGETYGTELIGLFGNVLISNGNREIAEDIASEGVMLGPVTLRSLIHPDSFLGPEPSGGEGARDRSEDLVGGADSDQRPIGPPSPWVRLPPNGREHPDLVRGGGSLVGDPDGLDPGPVDWPHTDPREIGPKPPRGHGGTSVGPPPPPPEPKVIPDTEDCCGVSVFATNVLKFVTPRVHCGIATQGFTFDYNAYSIPPGRVSIGTPTVRPGEHTSYEYLAADWWKTTTVCTVYVDCAKAKKLSSQGFRDQENPPLYTGGGTNCNTWVAEQLEDAGVVPSWGTRLRQPVMAQNLLYGNPFEPAYPRMPKPIMDVMSKLKSECGPNAGKPAECTTLK